MGEAAAPETAPEAALGNIGDFRLSGGRHFQIMRLVGTDAVRVDRQHPDPDRGRDVAGASRLESGRPSFRLPENWTPAECFHARTAIANAYLRARIRTDPQMRPAWTNPIARPIAFEGLEAVMTTAPGSRLVYVVEEHEGADPTWVATLTALHKDPDQVQMSWNGTAYADTFGRDPLGKPGRVHRQRLAREASAFYLATETAPR